MVDEPEEVAKARYSINFNELGQTGLVHTGGTIYEEFLPQLTGRKGAKVYREMRENSPVVGSMIFAIESLLRSVTWRVEPASDATEDLAAATFLEEVRGDMEHTWEDFISEALSMLVYGWSLFEVVWKLRQGSDTKGKHHSQFSDGKVGWAKFAIRDQESLDRWFFNDAGDVIAFKQYPVSPDYQEIPPIPMEKALLFRTTSRKNNPEGRSPLRSSYRPWYFMKRLEELEAIGVERNLAGLPVATVPIEILATDRGAAETSIFNSIKSMIVSVKRDEQQGLIFPSQFDENGNQLYEFKLLSASGTSDAKTGEIIARYSQQILSTLLADFLVLGHESVGSFALSSDKTELFAVALGAMLDSIEETINRTLVTKLFQVNGSGIEPSKLPKLRHGDIESPDLQELAGFISQTAAAGYPWFPNLQLENKLADMAGLPEQDPAEREQALQMMQGLGGPQDPNAQDPYAQEDQTVAKAAKPDENAMDHFDAQDSKGKATVRPSRFNGKEWRTLRGKHRWGGKR